MKYVVRVTAEINDEIEVEADSDEEAIGAAFEGWSFVEASSWWGEIVSREREETP
jgi:hypothetical protein